MDVNNICPQHITILLFNISSKYFTPGYLGEIGCPISFAACQKMNWYYDLVRYFVLGFSIIVLVQSLVLFFLLFSQRDPRMTWMIALLQSLVCVDLIHASAILAHFFLKNINYSNNNFIKDTSHDIRAIFISAAVADVMYGIKTFGIFLILMFCTLSQGVMTTVPKWKIHLLIIPLLLIFGSQLSLPFLIEISPAMYYNKLGNGLSLEMHPYVIAWVILHNVIFTNGTLFIVTNALFSYVLWKRRYFYKLVLLAIRSVPLRMNIATTALAVIEANLMSINGYSKSALFTALFNTFFGIAVLLTKLPILIKIYEIRNKKEVFQEDQYIMHHYLAINMATHVVQLVWMIMYGLVWIIGCPQLKLTFLMQLSSVVPKCCRPRFLLPKKLTTKWELVTSNQIYHRNNIVDQPDHLLAYQADGFLPKMILKCEEVRELDVDPSRIISNAAQDKEVKLTNLYKVQKLFEPIADENVTDVSTVAKPQLRNDPDAAHLDRLPYFNALVHMSKTIDEAHLFDRTLTNEERRSMHFQAVRRKTTHALDAKKFSSKENKKGKKRKAAKE